MQKAHRKLRSLMDDYDMIRDDLADVLDKSLSYVSSRIVGNKPWTIDDIYTICDYFNALDPGLMPYESIPEYFPRDGIGTATPRRNIRRIS